MRNINHFCLVKHTVSWHVLPKTSVSKQWTRNSTWSTWLSDGFPWVHSVWNWFWDRNLQVVMVLNDFWLTWVGRGPVVQRGASQAVTNTNPQLKWGWFHISSGVCCGGRPPRAWPGQSGCLPHGHIRSWHPNRSVCTGGKWTPMDL